MNSGKKILLQLIISFILLAGIIIWKIDFIRGVYFTDKITPLGLILNGVILIIFLSGIYKLIIGFLHYSFEEDQIAEFVKSKSMGEEDIFHKLSRKSIILRRFFKIKELYDRKIPINHSALSSIMLAEESLYQSLPRFVNNVLILTGVFGTIISLILALAGASTVLKTSVAGKGMWLILHGMNTALTTTATAIICFFFFSYFYHKLTDIQTHVFSKVEDAVLTYIIPDFTFDIDSINYKTDGLVRTLEKTVEKINSDLIPTEGILQSFNTSQLEIINSLIRRQEIQNEKIDTLINELGKIKETVIKGFRLESD